MSFGLLKFSSIFLSTLRNPLVINQTRYMSNISEVSSSLSSVTKFWFEDIHPSKHWIKNSEFDDELRARYLNLLLEVKNGDHDYLSNQSDGALALVLVLDQFSRNMYRDLPESFENDAKALNIAKSAIEQNLHTELSDAKKVFLYMPFMHSESLEDHDKSIELFAALNNPQVLNFANKHRDIILRFKRYPHRNKILQRESSPEEEEFLTQEGSSF